MDINKILKFGVEQKASDIHFSAGLPPWMRLDGDLEPIAQQSAIANDELNSALYKCMDENIRKRFEEFGEIDFAYRIKDLARFRVNIYNQENGIAGSFRIIPSEICDLKELGIPTVLKEVITLPRGLVLVTGPTGSGKSTTLASLIDLANENRKDHIITIEDPIEFLHSSKSCLVSQREVNRDTKNFNLALRAALREDPDIILVGEMRDLETIRLALTAAETGHLVFGTLHTVSAVKSIARVIDIFPGEERGLVRTMLSESLQAVLSQTLIKRVNGGRIAATELMLCNTAIRNLIREDKLPQAYSVLQTGSEQGMYTLDQNLQTLLEAGQITQATARSVAVDKSLFK